jgi:hypothetical protein
LHGGEHSHSQPFARCEIERRPREHVREGPTEDRIGEALAHGVEASGDARRGAWIEMTQNSKGTLVPSGAGCHAHASTPFMPSAV